MDLLKIDFGIKVFKIYFAEQNRKIFNFKLLTQY